MKIQDKGENKMKIQDKGENKMKIQDKIEEILRHKKADYSNSPEKNGGNIYISIPCLAGQDVCRKPGELGLVVKGSEVFGADYGDKIRVTIGEGIRGYGKIDEEGSYNLRPDGCAWFVSVGKVFWDGLSKKMAFNFEVAE